MERSDAIGHARGLGLYGAGPKQVERLVLSGAPQGMGQVRVLDLGRLGRIGHHLVTGRMINARLNLHVMQNIQTRCRRLLSLPSFREEVGFSTDTERPGETCRHRTQ